jgi:hypothetical protein
MAAHRCFQGSVACDGLLAYTFNFTSDFAVPRIFLEGDVLEVQEYLLHFQRLLDGERAISQADIYRRAEEKVRGELGAEMGRLSRLLEGEKARAQALSGELDVIKGLARADEDALRMRIEAVWRERLAETRAQSESTAALFREQMEAARAEVKSLQERVMTRDMTLRSSQGRGRIGEDAFAEAAERLAGWNLERSAGEARACDFVMKAGTYNVRFEIKNHNTSIPGADISKFQRDLEEHREDTGVGIFVALNVAVRAGAPLISHEWRADAGQLLIYISAFNDNDPEFIFMVLRNLLAVYERFRELRDSRDLGADESAELQTIRGRVDAAMIHIQCMARHIKELRLKLGRDKKTVLKMYDDSLEIMKSLSAEYSLSVGALLGSTPAEAEVDAEMEIEIPQQVVVIETPPEQQMPPPKRRRAPKKVLQAVTESQ